MRIDAIEAVVICVNYSDFLSHTLPSNLEHLDRMIVVTTPEDRQTKALCSKYGVDCLETNEFYHEGAPFNKGRGINQGLAHLKHEGWLLQLDADILLPHRFKTMLRKSRLKTDCLYGADRLNCPSYEHWIKHKHKTIPQFQYKCLVTPPQEFPLGARLIHNEFGYCPIGAFQLWHSSIQHKYPAAAGSAEHSDVVFALNWPREKRILLPDLFVYHLDSEGGAQMGANWKGRKTKPFGPLPKGYTSL